MGQVFTLQDVEAVSQIYNAMIIWSFSFSQDILVFNLIIHYWKFNWLMNTLILIEDKNAKICFTKTQFLLLNSFDKI